MAHQDWDLFAIVRSCKAAKTTVQIPPTHNTNNTTDQFPQVTTASSLATCSANQGNGTFSFPNFGQTRTNNGFQELHQLFTTTTSTNNSTSGGGGINNPNYPFSDFTAGSIMQLQKQNQRNPNPVLSPSTYTSIEASTSGSERFHHQQQPQQNQLQVQKPETSSMVPNTQSQTPRSRKRKSQQKKMVCHVTADNLSSDLWAWRKYGQKPIKGSPYPRNYYRCSSCKGCAARKQVERSTTEPNMFIVTYAGDHKHAKPAHRNSLAGSTRNKPNTTPLPETGSGSGPETGNLTNMESCPMLSSTTTLQENMNHTHDPVAARATCADDKDPEPDMASDEDDVLIPNTAALSDAVFLGTECYESGADGLGRFSSEARDGSDPYSGSGLDPTFSEPSLDNIRSSPG